MFPNYILSWLLIATLTSGMYLTPDTTGLDLHGICGSSSQKLGNIPQIPDTTSMPARKLFRRTPIFSSWFANVNPTRAFILGLGATMGFQHRPALRRTWKPHMDLRKVLGMPPLERPSDRVAPITPQQAATLNRVKVPVRPIASGQPRTIASAEPAVAAKPSPSRP